MLTYPTDRLLIDDWTPHLRDEVRRSALEKGLGEILTPAVLAHLPHPLQLGPRHNVSDWIDARAAEAEVHLVTMTTTGSLAGLLILAPFDGEPPDIHIGYLFAEEVWGKGLATEMLLGLVGAAPRPVRLLAGVEAGNPASARVLEKAGFAKPGEDGLYTLSLL